MKTRTGVSDLEYPDGRMAHTDVEKAELLNTFFSDVFTKEDQGITFEKARRATNRSLKMTIWSLGSDLCYEEKISARGRHYNTIRQGAPFHHCLSGRRHFNTTTRSL